MKLFSQALVLFITFGGFITPALAYSHMPKASQTCYHLASDDQSTSTSPEDAISPEDADADADADDTTDHGKLDDTHGEQQPDQSSEENSNDSDQQSSSDDSDLE